MNDVAADLAPQRAGNLSIERMSFAFPGEKMLFDDFSCSFARGWTAVLGASGAGKTTLLRLLAGRIQPQSGAIRRPGRSRIAWLGQSGGLLPWASAEDAVLLGARLRGERVDRGKARSLLARLGLNGQETKRPAQLSGGMQQRVALARALMEDADILLLDEPLAHLDAIAKSSLYELAAKELRGRTVVMVTHDPAEAIALADRILVLAGSPLRIAADVTLGAATPRDPRAAYLDATYARLLAALVTP